MNTVDIRDRTIEFFAVVNALTLDDLKIEDPPIDDRTPLQQSNQQSHADQFDAARDFNNAVRSVSLGISQAASRLQDLTELVKNKSIFEDNSKQIDGLTVAVKEEIQQLAKDIDMLQNFVDTNMGKTGSQSAEHSRKVVASLRAEVVSATQDFTIVLQTRSKNIKNQSDRRKQFSSAKSLAPKNRPSFGPRRPSDEDVEQMQSLLMQEQEQRDVGDDYLEARALAVRNIEKTIHELSGVFAHLATLVAAQDETILRIDDDVVQAHGHISQGHGQLKEYYDNLASNRWLILKIFVTIILFAIFFIIFVA